MTSVTFVEDDMRYLDPYQGQKNIMSPLPSQLRCGTEQQKSKA